MKTNIVLLLLVLCNLTNYAQLKYVVEDFEGLADGISDNDQKQNGIFAFGNVKTAIDSGMTIKKGYSGQRCIKVSKEGKQNYGGWGKGIGLNVELDPKQDFINFYIHGDTIGKNSCSIKIELQEDDNENGVYEEGLDDAWDFTQQLEKKNSWELISIPLDGFKPAKKGGDGIFNVNYKQGKLVCFIISFIDSPTIEDNQNWYFDFICFSKGSLPPGENLFDPLLAAANAHCSLGAWSAEGNKADFSGIASNFEKIFKPESDKKLGIIHFFQPFTDDKNSYKHSFVEQLNKLTQQGYIPMITFENHFADVNKKMKQPDLKSITSGQFDSFFEHWAKQIKQVNGVVLVRILHEFNGDWYPWCIANNNKDPELLIKAFRHIRILFMEQQVTNARFIWCPNSTSFPQEKWNFILDAYPGDEFVDYVGLDIYNGAGKELSVWRSFRKEGIENYFILTQHVPQKPLFVCETASRERRRNESSNSQDKAAWIEQMSEALKTDMSKVQLLNWFNEKETFKINSSLKARNAFLNSVLKDDYFKSGAESIGPLLLLHKKAYVQD